MIRNPSSPVPGRHPVVKICTYNILAESYATHQMYPHCPLWALLWSFRGPRVVSQLRQLDVDVLCLQVRAAVR